jgi:hypothetical protein
VDACARVAVPSVFPSDLAGTRPRPKAGRCSAQPSVSLRRGRFVFVTSRRSARDPAERDGSSTREVSRGTSSPSQDRVSPTSGARERREQAPANPERGVGEGDRCAALFGLLFIAVSIPVATISRSPELRNRSAQMLMLLRTELLVAASISIVRPGSTPIGRIARTLNSSFGAAEAGPPGTPPSPPIPSG